MDFLVANMLYKQELSTGSLLSQNGGKDSGGVIVALSTYRLNSYILFSLLKIQMCISQRKAVYMLGSVEVHEIPRHPNAFSPLIGLPSIQQRLHALETLFRVDGGRKRYFHGYSKSSLGW